MRKVFFGLLFVFIIATIILLSLNESPKDTVSLLTIYQDYSRIISKKDEIISIPVYVDYLDSFLLTPEAITSAYLIDNLNTLEVNIENIRKTEEVDKLNEETYYLFNIDIKFPYNLESEQLISLNNCKLEINYINDESIDLEIGNMYLMFKQIEENNQISLYRMFSLTDFYNGKEYISAVLLGLTNITKDDLKIISIENNIPTMNFDLKEAIFTNEELDIHENVSSIINHEYNPIGNATLSNSIDLIDNKLLFMPIKYENTIQITNRFPIIIKYIYKDKEYYYIIDDFMFFNPNYTLEDYYGSIRECIYNYK